METEYYTPEESKEIAKRYKDLLRESYQTLSEEDKKLIRKAFDVAVDAHKEQRRKSGEPYIFHPIAVAKIVAYNIGLDAVSIAAALLHDVVEDTPITIEEIAQNFGDVIAKIVKGLTKISNLSRDTDVSFQAENFRKMLLTLNDDVRVILIKIADRLHNMQTMDAMPTYKQQKIASETLFIYAPLAHRIGLYIWDSNIPSLTSTTPFLARWKSPRRNNSSISKSSPIRLRLPWTRRKWIIISKEDLSLYTLSIKRW